MLSRRERPTFDVFHLDSSSEETTSWRCDHALVPWFLVSVLHVVKYRALFPRKCCFDNRNWTNLLLGSPWLKWEGEERGYVRLQSFMCIKHDHGYQSRTMQMLQHFKTVGPTLQRYSSVSSWFVTSLRLKVVKVAWIPLSEPFRDTYYVTKWTWQ